MKEQIERPSDAVRATRVIAAEVIELTEHNVDANRGHEPGHDRVRHKSQERTQPQQTRDDHHHTSQDREREQRTRWVVTATEIDVSNNDRHGTSCLHRHERCARKERTADHPVQVAVQTGDRIDAGEQAARETIWDALHTKHQTRERIVLHRLSLEK